MILTATNRIQPLASPTRPPCRERAGLLKGFLCLLLLLLMPGAGRAQESDVNKVTSLLERFDHAARQGDAVAQTNLGAMYLHGVGVRRNVSKAQYWFQRAAEQDEGLAQFNLGVLAQEGQGGSRDDQKAVHWFRRVASQTNRSDQLYPLIKGWAQLKLGFIYYEGRGVAKDYQEAMAWFRRAAERGILMAQEMLAQMYAQGLGGSVDDKRAFFWYEQAARQGSSSSEKALQTLSKKLTPQQQSEARALEPQPRMEGKDPPISTIPASLAGVVTPQEWPLTVVTQPADALVRLLNIRPAYTPGIALKPGKYHLEVSRSGYRTEKLWVTVQESAVKVEVALTPESTAQEQAPQNAAQGAKEQTTRKPLTAPPVKTAHSTAEPSPGLPDKASLSESSTAPASSAPTAAAAAPAKPALSPPRTEPVVPQAPVAKPASPPKKAASFSAPRPASSDSPASRQAVTDSADKKAPSTRQAAVTHPKQPVKFPMPRKAGRGSVPSPVPDSMPACPVAEQPPASKPKRYALTVQSDPEDAHVQIANGKIPYQPGLSLAPGRYPLTISKEAFKTRQCWAEIADRDVDLAVALRPVAPGELHRLTIQPQPTDALVRLLNIRAPYRPGILLESGSYQVEVSKKGYKTERRTLELGNTDRTVPIRLVELPLQARPTLTVVPVLQGVQIRILNADQPYHPGVPLAPGRYLLELVKPGFKTQQRWVELSEQDVKVEVALEEDGAAVPGANQ
ncbi:MAG: SEL1-like repeat protein [Magnetococcales bacterium]|nr:SEL1-like repeat protein [Magnetococcales bacterium]